MNQPVGRPDGTTRQAKVLATVSIETLLGMQRTTGDLLTRLVGGRMHLTAVAARRLADAGCDFRLIVHGDAGATVGVGRQTRVPPGRSAPTNVLTRHPDTVGATRMPSRPD